MGNMQINWKDFFSQGCVAGVVTTMEAARIALNNAINHEGRIIHPGAFIVFRRLLQVITETTDITEDRCKNADLDSFYKNDHPENEENN